MQVDPKPTKRMIICHEGASHYPGAGVEQLNNEMMNMTLTPPNLAPQMVVGLVREMRPFISGQSGGW